MPSSVSRRPATSSAFENAQSCVRLLTRRKPDDVHNRSGQGAAPRRRKWCQPDPVELAQCVVGERSTVFGTQSEYNLTLVFPPGSYSQILCIRRRTRNASLDGYADLLTIQVFADFSSLMAAYRGELEVVVTSAEALDQRAMQRLERALKGTEAAQGKTLKISNKVSRTLIACVGSTPFIVRSTQA